MLFFFVITGFFVGLYYQRLAITYSIIAVGIIIAATVTIPSWPIFRKNPVNWRPLATKKQSQVFD